MGRRLLGWSLVLYGLLGLAIVLGGAAWAARSSAWTLPRPHAAG